MNWKSAYSKKIVSALDAVALVKSLDTVFVQGGAATPTPLLEALVERASELRDVRLVHLHLEGPVRYADEEFQKSFRSNCLFISANLRKAVAEGRADYTPIFLSEVPRAFKSGAIPLDVAFVQVSAPDQHGMCTLGVSVDCARQAVHSAKKVIAVVNPNMPRTHGDGFMHISEMDRIVEVDAPIYSFPAAELTSVERQIGVNVAELIEDGATIQTGIGAIPDAVLAELGNHRELGVHSEMFSDGVLDLVEKEVITGSNKTKHPGKIIGGFVMGSQRLYDFVDDNPMVQLLDIGYINSPATIAKNSQMTAINSAIEVDITGQVVADSIGSRFFSGIGGQMDFMRGAAMSPGGKAIIALPSQTSKGESRIVATLKPCAGVVTTRGHVQFVVTEWGVAELHARPIRQRVEAMISIAHPDHREELAAQAIQFGWL